MGRGNDKGKDFDDQFNLNRDRGRDRASRGESHWSDDAALRRINQERDAAGKKDESCGKVLGLFFLALVGGIGAYYAFASAWTAVVA